MRIEHILTFVGIAISVLFTINIFLLNIIRSEINDVRKDLNAISDKYVSEEGCSNRRKMICRKVEEIDSNFSSHFHEDGKVVVHKS